MLTTSRWDPHQTAFAENDENMLDWQGNLINRSDRHQILLADIEEDNAMIAYLYVGIEEAKVVNVALGRSTSNNDLPEPLYHHVPFAADEIASLLGAVSPLLEYRRLYNSLSKRVELGRFQASIGSTNTTTNNYLVVEDYCSLKACTCEGDMSDGSDQILDNLFDSSI